MSPFVLSKIIIFLRVTGSETDSCHPFAEEAAPRELFAALKGLLTRPSLKPGVYSDPCP